MAINQKKEHKCKASMRKEMIKVSDISNMENRNKRETQ